MLEVQGVQPDHAARLHLAAPLPHLAALGGQDVGGQAGAEQLVGEALPGERLLKAFQSGEVLSNVELNRMESQFLDEIKPAAHRRAAEKQLERLRFNVLVKPDLFCSFCEKLLAEQAANRS